MKTLILKINWYIKQNIKNKVNCYLTVVIFKTIILKLNCNNNDNIIKKVKK